MARKVCLVSYVNVCSKITGGSGEHISSPDPPALSARLVSLASQAALSACLVSLPCQPALSACLVVPAIYTLVFENFCKLLCLSNLLLLDIYGLGI